MSCELLTTDFLESFRHFQSETFAIDPSPFSNFLAFQGKIPVHPPFDSNSFWLLSYLTFFRFSNFVTIGNWFWNSKIFCGMKLKCEWLTKSKRSREFIADSSDGSKDPT